MFTKSFEYLVQSRVVVDAEFALVCTRTTAGDPGAIRRGVPRQAALP